MGDPTGGTVSGGTVPGACPLYREAAGVGSCADRHSATYLGACIDYPSDRRQLLPRCSYRFVRIPFARKRDERAGVNS